MSTNSYQLSVKAFYCSHMSDSNGIYKITRDKMEGDYEALCDCDIR